MLLWQSFTVAGFVFLIFEMFLPTMFFLNFAIGAFLSAVVAYFVPNVLVVVPVFVVISLLCLLLLRNVLLKHKSGKNTETGFADKYIGKTAKATSDIDERNGSISIYDERWEARSFNEQKIPAGAEVKIVNNDSLILIVKEVKE